MRKPKLLRLYLLLVIFGTFSICPQTSSLNENQKNVIIDNCDSIKETLKNVQKKDSRTRVYLGGHFETILSKYIKPLNHRIIENSISNTDIVSEQSTFANMKTEFSEDFIAYQKSLDELIAADCKNEPDNFYKKLESTRSLRTNVLDDVNELKKMTLEHLSSVKLLKEKI